AERRAAIRLADADHRADDDARFRRDVLCLGDTVVADLRAGTFARRRTWLRVSRGGAGDRIRVDCIGDGAYRKFSKAGKSGSGVGGRVWRCDSGVWSLDHLLGFFTDAGNHWRGRHGQHGVATNNPPARHTESSARAHDVDQHDVLYGWSTAWRA